TDLLGAGLGVVGLVLINFAWNQAPVVGWNMPYTYVLLIVGILFIGLFAFVEFRVSKFPLIPFHLISPNAGFVLACVAFGWASFGIWVFYLWQILEELRHISPLLASAQLVLVCLSGLAATIVTGYIIHRVPGSFVMMCSVVAFTVGSILLATVPVDQTYWAQTFVSIIIMPWGMDMSFPAANLLLSNSMPKEHQGVSASLVNTIINYSISLALGFAGTIEVHVNNGDTLKGYRGALYFAIGMGSAGIVTAGLFGFNSWRKSRGKPFSKWDE
ncbi:Drug resistance protein, partial [Lachnellula suecica]